MSDEQPAALTYTARLDTAYWQAQTETAIRAAEAEAERRRQTETEYEARLEIARAQYTSWREAAEEEHTACLTAEAEFARLCGLLQAAQTERDALRGQVAGLRAKLAQANATLADERIAAAKAGRR